MCIAPNILADGTATACHKCWQCREQAVNDWVGRNIAENKTSVSSNAVTLTYGRDDENQVDHLHAAILTYSDVQKFIKLLRFHGYPVRYFVTGEYGTTKNRAHWHIILHWQDKVPPYEFRKNFHSQFWPHGHTYWDNHDAAAVRYNCKYILKNLADDAAQGHLAMSKKPPLGALYFHALAQQYVTEGLAPQSLEYSFAEVRRRKKDGTQEVLPFRLKDTSAENFLRDFTDLWAAQRPGQKLPRSELIEFWLTPDDEEERQIRKRWEGIWETTDRTPAQLVQMKKDSDRLLRIAELKKKAALWLEPTRSLDRVIINPKRKWEAPRTLEEWEDHWEREQNGTTRQEETRKLIEWVQRNTERIIDETHARQGRVKTTVNGKVTHIHPDDHAKSQLHRSDQGSKRP